MSRTMIYDLAILGGGPAGVAAGVYAARKQLRTIFITKDWNSQSVVSEGIENWIGTIKVPGIEFAENLKKHLQAYAGDVVDIHEGEWVKEVKRKSKDGNKEIFIVTTDKAEYEVRSVLVTTGSHRRKLDIPGAEKYDNKGLTYCASCDGPLFSGQNVAVVGGGNAAFEAAAQLLAYCPSVTLLNRTEKLRADPVTVNAVSKHPNFKLVNNAVPKEVKGDQFVQGFVYTDQKTGKDTELNVTGVFVEIGSLPTTELIKDLVKLDDYNRIIVDPRNQRASTPGIWAAGDATDGLYHQNNIAAGDAVKALEDIYIYLKTK
jgi:alkyl hydroperoxide reductase subunit F